MIDCKSKEGITIGLIDSLIYICRVLNKQEFDTIEIREALQDLKQDPDLNEILNK